MAFDINNQYTGSLFGKDRIGHTTPDAEASESLRPWLPVSYAAPWLPSLRIDQGHPVLANVVISHMQLVGADKSGGLCPAGMRCGTSTLSGAQGGYFAIKYSQNDVNFAYNPKTGNLVAAAGEVVVLAAASDATAGDTITFTDGTTYTVTSGDITFASACDLFPSGVVRPIGIATKNVFQYLGGVTISSTTHGIKYTLDGVIPVKFRVHNYMHEMATALQTRYVLRLPWIGANPTDLAAVATSQSVAGYTQSDYSRSFVHFTGGSSGLAQVPPAVGDLVKASSVLGDSGHYAKFVVGTDPVDQHVGRVIAVQGMFPIRDFLNRVRTLWDPSRLTGPMKDPNPSSIQMGGSATAGIDYQLNLGTDGLFGKCIAQGITPDPKSYTYVYVAAETF